MKNKKAGVRDQGSGEKNVFVISGAVVYILLFVVLSYGCGRKGNPVPPEDITKGKDSYYYIGEVKNV